MLKRLHVALFGPPDMAERVVIAALFIAGIVAAGSVGSGNEQFRILVIPDVTRELALHSTDHDHAPTMTNELQRLYERRG